MTQCATPCSTTSQGTGNDGYAGGFRECDVGVLEYSDRTRETVRDSRNEASERGCLYNVRALIRSPSSQFQGEANRAKADEQLRSAETTHGRNRWRPRITRRVAGFLRSGRNSLIG